MRKEIILAIIFGIIVATIVSVFIYLRSDDDILPQNNSQSQTTSEEIIVDENDSKIKITHPVDEEVYSEKTIAITGETWPNALVVIFINDNQDIALANDQGIFNLDTNLESGSNIITAYSIDEQNNKFSAEITVVYSNKSLDEVLVSDSDVEAAAATLSGTTTE